MLALLNAYFAYDKNPKQAVCELVEKRHFGAALAGYAAAALCWTVFFWVGEGLNAWGLLWRFVFFWLLEVTMGYLWAGLSGLFLNFFSNQNGSSALFVVLGLSGFCQGIILAFALIAAVFGFLKSLAVLVLAIVFLLRFVFVLLNTSRVAGVGLAKAFCILCFAFIPVAAIGLLFLGAIGLLVGLMF